MLNLREQPLVSVLMTSHNREKYIAEAIESVLESTYTNFELIIVDDCSEDNTVNIAKEYEAKDERIRVYVNEKNLGDYANRNRAAGYANGKYIKYLDSDDYFKNGGLEYCINMMEENPEAEWAICAKTKEMIGKILMPSEIIHKHFFEKPLLMIGPGGAIMKASFFKQIGMYPTSYGPANDMYFNLQAATKGKLLLLDDIFLFYRIHEGQELNNNIAYLYNNYNYMKDAIPAITPFLKKQELKWVENKYKRRFLNNILKHFWETKDFKSVNEMLSRTGFSLKDTLQGIFH